MIEMKKLLLTNAQQFYDGISVGGLNQKIFARSLRSVIFAVGAISACHTVQAQDASPVPRGYMVISYDIKNQAEFKKYMDAAGSLAAKFNGKVTIFNMHVKGVEGKPRSVFGMVEFPNLADAERFYRSPEYTAARQFRSAATQGTSTVILTEGLPQ